MENLKNRYINGMVGILFLAFLVSCERDEGFGGTSSISGKIMMREYSLDQSILLQESVAADQTVYILFGGRPYIGDDVETTYEGRFSFNFLTPGDYEVYYYSDDSTAGSTHQEVAYSVVTSLANKQDLDLGTLYTYRYRDFDDGGATIRGRVMMINYRNSAIPPLTDADIKDIVPAQDLEVYLKYGDKEGYDVRVRTDYEGYFQFNSLIKGDYRIYVFSEHLVGGRYDGVTEGVIRYPQSQGSFDLVLYQDVEISNYDQEITLEDFTAEKQ